MAYAIDQFAALGIQMVDERCNRERQEFLRWLQEHRRGPDADMLGTAPWGALDKVTLAAARAEATPAFRLRPPLILPVPVIFLAGVLPKMNPQVPMWAWRDGRIGVNTLVARNSSEKDVQLHTWHEMLHLCGDTAYDGIIRHHWCGSFVVARLVSGGREDWAEHLRRFWGCTRWSGH